MDPREFLKTAALLKDKTDEHCLRTSISRSYYASHLYARQFISKKYLGGKNFKHDSHRYVLKCFNSCKSEDLRAIAVILKDLLQNRHDADYKMNLKITPTKCQDVYDDAEELLVDFESKLAVNENKQQLAHSSIQQAKFAQILV